MGLAAGLSLPAALVLSGIGGGIGALAAMSMREKQARVEPTQVSEPWRQRVSAALSARRRLDRAVGDVGPGPLRERLDEVARRLDVAVLECWTVARQGDKLDAAVTALGLEGIRARMASSGSQPEAVAEALRAQLEAGEQLQEVSRQTHERLRVLTARMDEAVARAVGLAARGSGAGEGAEPIGTDIDGLVVELKALQSALEETGRA